MIARWLKQKIQHGGKKKLLAIGLVLLAFFFLTQFASAQSGSGPVKVDLDNSSIGWVASFVFKGIALFLYAIYKFVGIFLNLSMWILDTLLSPDIYNQVFLSEGAKNAINVGWKTVRDFFNLFFIMIVLFIAICTILRVPKFSDKKMLTNVLVAALLVNFSKPITIFVVDISQLAMSFFMQNIKGIGGQASYSFFIADKMQLSSLFNTKFSDSVALVVVLIFVIIFMFILAAMLMILALGLIYRMVAIWVLIILSPMAFVGLALPGTMLSQMKDRWVTKLVNWAFFGPILLFFLWLSMTVLNEVGKSASSFSGSFTGIPTDGNGSAELMGSLLKLFIPFAVVIYFLYYGFDLSKEMAAKAGSSISGLMRDGEAKLSNWLGKGRRAALFPATAAAGAVGGAVGARYGAIKSGLGERDDKWNLLTSAGRKKRRDKKMSELQSRVSGNMEGYERDKANEQYKKMKDSGLTDAEVESKLKSGDKFTAAGAAKLLAERGKLERGTNTYKDALTAAGRVSAIKTQFDDLAKKKNLNAVISHELDAEASRLSLPNRAAMTAAQAQPVLDKYLKGKGIEAFSEQGEEFFQNSQIKSYLNAKYNNPTAPLPANVKGQLRQAAINRINDPVRLAEILSIIG